MIIFTLLFAVLIICSKAKPAETFLKALKIGGGAALIGLLMSYLYSQESFYNVVTFKDYYFTGGFGKIYLFGLSVLCAIPIAAIYKAIDQLILYIYDKKNDENKP